jgi:NAD(P)-dependent dehydrogenase (short-subunit alcohol dehydrogenase family)
MESKTSFLGIDRPRAVVVGASGGIGAAFARAFLGAGAEVWGTSRSGHGGSSSGLRWSSLEISRESSIAAFSEEIAAAGFQPNVVLNCTGLLHCKGVGPERSWRHLDMESMRRVFEVNTFGVALLGKHLIPLLPRRERSIFATLSARIGSIGDNRLGGWHSYRASKAAQNMIVKNLSIEASMKWPGLVCVALHPGTVDTGLSKPFTSRTPRERLFTAEQSCTYLCSVMERLGPKDSGGLFAWDGQPIPF